MKGNNVIRKEITIGSTVVVLSFVGISVVTAAVATAYNKLLSKSSSSQLSSSTKTSKNENFNFQQLVDLACKSLVRPNGMHPSNDNNKIYCWVWIPNNSSGGDINNNIITSSEHDLDHAALISLASKYHLHVLTTDMNDNKLLEIENHITSKNNLGRYVITMKVDMLDLLKDLQGNYPSKHFDLVILKDCGLSFYNKNKKQELFNLLWKQQQQQQSSSSSTTILLNELCIVEEEEKAKERTDGSNNNEEQEYDTVSGKDTNSGNNDDDENDNNNNEIFLETSSTYEQLLINAGYDIEYIDVIKSSRLLQEQRIENDSSNKDGGGDSGLPFGFSMIRKIMKNFVFFSSSTSTTKSNESSKNNNNNTSSSPFLVRSGLIKYKDKQLGHVVIKATTRKG